MSESLASEIPPRRPVRQVVLCSLGAIWIVAALAMWLAWPRSPIEGAWESTPGPTGNVFHAKFGSGGEFSLAFKNRILVDSKEPKRWSRRPGPVFCNREAGQRAAFKFKLLPPDAAETNGFTPMEGDVYWISDTMFFVLDNGRLLQNQGMVLERVTPLTRLKRWCQAQFGKP